MILITIASVLNALFLLLTVILVLTQDIPTEGPELFFFILMIIAPIVNLIALWTKCRKEKLPVQELKERIEKIESALQQEPPKP